MENPERTYHCSISFGNLKEVSFKAVKSIEIHTLSTKQSGHVVETPLPAIMDLEFTTKADKEEWPLFLTTSDDVFYTPITIPFKSGKSSGVLSLISVEKGGVFPISFEINCSPITTKNLTKLPNRSTERILKKSKEDESPQKSLKEKENGNGDGDRIVPQSPEVNKKQSKATKLPDVVRWTVLEYASDNVLQNYKKGKRLGKGAYGSVWEYKATDEDGFDVAIKKPHPKNYQQDKVFREIDIQKEIDSPFTLRIFGYNLTSIAEKSWIASELCSADTLFEVLKHPDLTKDAQTREELAKEYFEALFRAVSSVHHKDYVHRDIKPQNILLSFDGKRVKLADFGLATQITERGQVLTQRVGTPYYMAPEVYAGSYTEKCDVWSLGVVLYQFLSAGKLPFEGKDIPGILKSIKSYLKSPTNLFTDSLWMQYHPDTRVFISKLLTPEGKRPSVEEALADPWFNNTLEKKVDEESKANLLKVLKLTGPNPKQNDFIRNLCFICITTLLPLEREDLTAFLFAAFDKNKDGEISFQELKDYIHKQFPDDNLDNRIEMIFDYLDIDGNDMLSYSEFCTLFYELDKRTLKRVFKILDTNGDGFLTDEDFSTDPNSKILSKMVKLQADLDDDGKVSLEEWTEAALSGRKKTKKKKN